MGNYGSFREKVKVGMQCRHGGKSTKLGGGAVAIGLFTKRFLLLHTKTKNWGLPMPMTPWPPP